MTTPTRRHARAWALRSTLALALAGCGGGTAVTTEGRPAPAPAASDVVEMLAVLSADSMEGREVGTPGGARAARWIEGRMREYGLEPAVNRSYRQIVPMVERRAPDGTVSVGLLREGDTLGSGRRVEDVNLIGLVRGADPAVRNEAVVVGAHFDHIGIGPAVEGDSIYNGADDDGSGVVAVLEAARQIARGPAPRRTIVFLLTTAEEVGILGTFHYAAHPVIPLSETVADLQVEMIGRPDSLAGGPGKLWLTGYERSTMGEQLAQAGIPVVADPRPQMNFFQRSDNIVFAWEGIPAHTLSSYGMHRDYHEPSDEIERVDPAHLRAAAATITRAVRLVADGARPEWHPGGRPERPATLPWTD